MTKDDALRKLTARLFGRPAPDPEPAPEPDGTKAIEREYVRNLFTEDDQ